jgi:hypothetical protein
MKRAIFSVLLGLLGLGILFTSAALAAPGQSLSSSAEPVALFQATITPTTELTSTTSHTHPVAAAIAAYFSHSDVFTTPVTYAGIMALHEEGLGFGVIAKAYFAAEKLGIDPQVLLDAFAAGMGWGQIMKENGLHPGRAGRGGSLGDIMSGHGNSQLGDSGAGHTPPGQLKKGNGQSGNDDQDNGGPGKNKDKNKDKGKGRDK